MNKFPSSPAQVPATPFGNNAKPDQAASDASSSARSATQEVCVALIKELSLSAALPVSGPKLPPHSDNKLTAKFSRMVDNIPEELVKFDQRLRRSCFFLDGVSSDLTSPSDSESDWVSSEWSVSISSRSTASGSNV